MQILIFFSKAKSSLLLYILEFKNICIKILTFNIVLRDYNLEKQAFKNINDRCKCIFTKIYLV